MQSRVNKPSVVRINRKFSHQKLSVVNTRSIHILHCVDICGLIGNQSIAHLVAQAETHQVTQTEGRSSSTEPFHFVNILGEKFRDRPPGCFIEVKTTP